MISRFGDQVEEIAHKSFRRLVFRQIGANPPIGIVVICLKGAPMIPGGPIIAEMSVLPRCEWGLLQMDDDDSLSRMPFSVISGHFAGLL